jgi:putative ABC transport system permease protein
VNPLSRKLFRDLWARKGSFLTLVMIVTIGVACHVSMASVWNDLDGARQRYYSSYRLADFWVDLERAPASVLDEVRRLPNVASVEGRVSLGVLLDLPSLSEPVTGTVISVPFLRTPVLNDLHLRTGTWFSRRDAAHAIVNHSFAVANGIRPGDRLKVTLLDAQHELLVIGTAMSPEFVYLLPPGGGLAPDPARFGVVYCTTEFLRRTCDQEGAYNQVVGRVHDSSAVALENTLTLIEERLDAYGVTGTTPVHLKASPRFLADELAGLGVSATVLPGIFLAVAALVLNVLLARMVGQQRSVVGTLRALGYTSGKVTRHFIAYGVLVGGLGGAAGLALGTYLQEALLGVYRQFYDMPGIEGARHGAILARGLGISLVFALLGTIRAARRASKLQPAEAMRPKPPERGGRIVLEAIPLLWGRLSFRWRLVLRTVFRNPFRTLVGVFAAAISTALILTALATQDGLDYLMRYTFERISHEDTSVSLRTPAGRRVVREMNTLPAVERTEPQLVVSCEVRHGARRRRTAVTGLPRANELHTPLDDAGRPLVVPDRGLILSRKLAEILGVGVGDRINVRPLIGQRVEVSAPVVGLVDTFLGLGAYADQRYLSSLLGEEWAANVLLGREEPGGARTALLAALKDRPTVVGLGERERSLHQIQATFGETMGGMMAVLILFAGAIAFGSVLNAAFVSLSERQREVGTLRCLGYTPGQVAWIFAAESLLVTATGVALGIALGVGLSQLLAQAYSTELYRFPVVVLPLRVAQSAGLMLLFGAFAQAVVYRLVLRLPWLDLLKVKE